MTIKNNKQEIIFEKGIPKKNKLIQALLWLEIPLAIPFIKSYIKRYLKNCHNIDFILGFKFFYGNIYANNVFLGNTFFMDYSPIYIGDNSKLSHDNIFITGEHDHNNFTLVKSKPIIIGKNVWITTRCIILGGVTIGDNTVIGAGSIVTHDIPANCLAAGNPAKVIKYFKKFHNFP